MDSNSEFPQPKPLNTSKPPVKSWSELLSGSSSNSSVSLNYNCKQSATSGLNSICASRPNSTVGLENEFEALKLDSSGSSDDFLCAPDAEFLYRPLSIPSRPISNLGNRCYMISVLQTLLHTKLFSNYIQKYFFRLQLLPSVLETEKFPLLSALKSFYSHFRGKTSNNSINNGPVPHEALDDIFIALQSKNGSFSSAGFSEQEDAEEFLTALLDSLGEEFIAIQSQKLLSFCQPMTTNESTTTAAATASSKFDNKNDGGDEWLQVGPKQRIVTTRSTPITLNPIHSLFSGSFESLYRAPGIRPSITFEPFTILPLSLVREGNFNAPLDSVPGAIENLLRSEDLGKKCTKQLSFASLPPVLIIQLKRFIYRSEGKASSFELHKLTKSLKIPLQLHLHQSQNTSNSITYNLYALVNHHGNSPNTGHYTATIKLDSTDHLSSSLEENLNYSANWFNFDDDAKLERVPNVNGVLNQNSSAYLLFYERQRK